MQLFNPSLARTDVFCFESVWNKSSLPVNGLRPKFSWHIPQLNPNPHDGGGGQASRATPQGTGQAVC